MRAEDPAQSYCCGATMEAFMLAWRGYVGARKDLTAEQMQELYRWFFVFDAARATGVQGGLEKIGEELSWLRVETQNNPRLLPFGAFVQIQYGETIEEGGHSAVVLGKGRKHDHANGGNPYIVVWSSNRGYDYILEMEHTTNFLGPTYLVKDGERSSGHGADYWSMEKTGRQFFGAWIV